MEVMGAEEARTSRVVVAAAGRSLNPNAKEFVPRWHRHAAAADDDDAARRTKLSADAPEFVYEGFWRGVDGLTGYGYGYGDGHDGAPEELVVVVSERLNPDAPEFTAAASIRRRRSPGSGNGISSTRHWSRRGSRNFSRQGRSAPFSSRVRRAQKEEFVRRTIFVSDIDHTVTEDMLAELFGSYCSVVVDCRICGDHSSGLRFAFIEFQDESDAYAALDLDGYVLGICPLRVSPSKTAIMPVNPSFLPQVNVTDLKYFCEEHFGQVFRLKLLGDDGHPTRIAFIEFAEVDGAINALNSSGIFASGQPIRFNNPYYTG
uniref:RNA-binding protein-like n=2 Tax=Oryza TaxID=4527 RepID=Q69M19_ORYSJ|nr:RNA-binding protein-like [Oryza sativa Japonica Group]